MWGDLFAFICLISNSDLWQGEKEVSKLMSNVVMKIQGAWYTATFAFSICNVSWFEPAVIKDK